jgi:hypothetical protein
MLHMVLDERALGVWMIAFHRLQLLREIHAGATALGHGEERRELPLCLLQTLDNVGARRVFHSYSPTP